MAYYTGSVNSYEDLITLLFTNCVANGWTANEPILSKGTSHLSFTVNSTAAANTTLGAGIIMQPGSGSSGSTLTGVCPIKPRFGPPHKVNDPPTWPMTYHMFIFDNPDEVYLVANFNVDYYYWLAFGKSSIAVPGTGLWCAAISRPGDGAASPGQSAVAITPTTGGGQTTVSSCALFWYTNNYSNGVYNNINYTMNVQLNGFEWAGVDASHTTTQGTLAAVTTFGTRMTRQPNLWNGEGVLIRVQPVFGMPEFKAAVVADLKNARFIRVDNYTPGQVITLGTDSWKVFPFFRKDTSARDSGTANHTGTFGWALRYDGP